MEEEKDPSAEYIKAFNDGYNLSKHQPDVLNKVLKSDNQGNQYMQAMKAGKKQHDKEKLIQEQQRIKEKQMQQRPKN